ncbi:protein C-mannosyl-transferase DPY19L1 [Battus philenor]|uniref:protein C-mannosyl-transferase DPY19L1 n=1 Tax=Battus philenor TaxID=42288 RepID=UPI0035CF7959
MAEGTEGVQVEQVPTNIKLKSIAKFSFLGIVAIILGGIHSKYVSNLFENDRNFSYLSDLEREMSLRTEMGFYYSYYKTIVEETPFISGISKLMYDKLVEHPNEVNAFNRFNIHPEVIIGAAYRYFEPFLNNSYYRECHLVEREVGQSLIKSCVGIGHPMFFYLEAIWWLAGLTVAAIFLHAVTLSESFFGGLLAVFNYFANHSECTRVQWAPNERENLALPLLLLQSWLLTLQLREKSKKTSFQLQISIVILNGHCLLFWQFTQFIFLTQIAIFFIMEQLYIIDIKSFSIFLHSHFCGLHMAVLLLQGNDMLKSSLYTSFFVVVSVYCLFFSSLRIKVQNRFDLFVESWLILLRILIAICTSIYLKKIISEFLETEEDGHIWDILYSKFTNYRTFHTMLYTCSEVFDYLPFNSIMKMLVSFLIPIVIINVYNVFGTTVITAVRDCEKIEEEGNQAGDKASDGNETDDSGIENNTDTKVRLRQKRTDLDVIEKEVKVTKEKRKVEKDILLLFLKGLRFEPALFYNIAQMAVYFVMALLVMRLKLLFATHLCLLSSLMFSKKYYVLPKSFIKWLPVAWLLLMVPMVYSLVKNVSEEMSHVGEFSDYHQEELLQWVSGETGSGAFAGSMPVLATIMLCARRPIVAHPHYEHLDTRKRAYSVYKTYGRFSSEELYMELSRLKVTYLIVETKYCYGRSNKGCSFLDIWDIEAPTLSHRPSLCHKLLTEYVEHFYPVFRNQQYAVFRVHDYSVRYMPRSFDT